eukprot:7642714-Pyramimonas_sp.AAC.1
MNDEQGGQGMGANDADADTINRMQAMAAPTGLLAVERLRRRQRLAPRTAGASPGRASISLRQWRS